MDMRNQIYGAKKKNLVIKIFVTENYIKLKEVQNYYLDSVLKNVNCKSFFFFLEQQEGSIDLGNHLQNYGTQLEPKNFFFLFFCGED